MRKEKALLALLGNLVKLLGDEASRNPEFAAKMEALLSPLSDARQPKKRRAGSKLENLPDIHAEFSARGEQEFQLWLREQPVGTLRALIRLHDMDASRRTAKWKDADKLSAFVTEQISARLSRGSGFLSPKSS